MKTILALASVAFIGLAANSPAHGAELRIRAGEKRILPTRNAQGVTLDNPKIAETRIVSGRQVEVVGKGNGDGTLSIFTADGKTQTYSVHVSGALPDAGEGNEDETNEAWPAARFGGKRILHSRCGEPLGEEKAVEAFEEARGLLKKDQVSEAIPKLDRVLQIEPDAAIAHLFLGAAWAKLKDQGRGAYHYETFVLSCPDDPKANAVVRLLREFHRQVPKTKPVP